MAHAPIFYDDVSVWYERAFIVLVLIIELVAFFHCVTRRREAFPAVGNATKGMWTAMTFGAIVWTVLFSFSPLGFWFGILGVVVSAVYLLDLRPAIKDALEGRGGW